MPSKNANLRKADWTKNDEFYTQLSDIENELRHYKEHFKWKTVLCNCDDPRISNFFHYFAYNFEHLWLKRLITTCYKNQNPDLFSQYKSEKAVYLIYDWDKNWNHIPDPEEIWIRELKWDGDFRSEECIELLKQADIVCTNPPFSIAREYFLPLLLKHNKKFLIVGDVNWISYKNIFPLIKDNIIWTWYNYIKSFLQPNWEIKKFGNKLRFTNLDIKKRHEDLIMYKKYNPEDYQKFDNYDAININKISEIPEDYYWIMWVPISFIDKYNPEQFEIIEWLNRYTVLDLDWRNEWARKNHIHFTCIDWKPKFFRILIRRKK